MRLGIYVGGWFEDAGGMAEADHIVHWDGTSWHALGVGLSNGVIDLEILGTDVYVGGIFTDVGGIAEADYIARWDGTSWHALGAGLSDGVMDLEILGTDVYVGGRFTDVGGIAEADYIARWDGTSWHALGAGVNGVVMDLVISEDNLYVGGLFNHSGDYATSLSYFAWYGPSVAQDINATTQYSTLVDDNDDLHIAWTNRLGEVKYRNYDLATETWQDIVNISDNGVADSVTLSKRTNGSLELIWSQEGDIKFSEGSSPFATGDWATQELLYTEGENVAVTSLAEEALGFIPYFWIRGQSAPYNLVANALDFTLTISGTITENGHPLFGVTIDAGPLGSATTAQDGKYHFASIPYGTQYSLHLTKANTSFSPNTPKYSRW